MEYRVLIYDAALRRRVYAYGEDGRELRFKTMEAASDAVHPLVGHGKRWPCLYVIERAPQGQPMAVVTQKAPRRFARLTGTPGRRFKRLGRA